MIILYNKKNEEKRIPSEEHIKTYRFCLCYLVSDLKVNGLYTTAHLLEIAMETLQGPQNFVPYGDDDLGSQIKNRGKQKRKVGGTKKKIA